MNKFLPPLLAVVLVGCGTESGSASAVPSDPQGPPAPVGTVSFETGRQARGAGIGRLQGFLHADGSFSYTFDFVHDSGWATSFSKPGPLPEHYDSGPPPGPVAMAQMNGLFSTSGALDVSFFAARVEGRFRGTPSDLNASFVSAVEYECLVPVPSDCVGGCSRTTDGPEPEKFQTVALTAPGCEALLALSRRLIRSHHEGRATRALVMKLGRMSTCHTVPVLAVVLGVFGLGGCESQSSERCDCSPEGSSLVVLATDGVVTSSSSLCQVSCYTRVGSGAGCTRYLVQASGPGTCPLEVAYADGAHESGSVTFAESTLCCGGLRPNADWTPARR